MEKGTKEYIEFRKKANERNKKYYSKPEVKIKKKLYKQEYERKNREKIREYQNSRYKVQKENKNLWSQRFPEKVKAYKNKKETKIRKSKSDKRYREKRKEREGSFWMDNKTRDRHKQWYENNREHLRALRKAYYNSEKGRLSIVLANHRRLARKKFRTTDLTRNQIRDIFERDKVCVYCKDNKNLELDHIIPLVREGTCNYDNFVLACAKCNRSKSGRDVIYWCGLQGIEVPKIILELLEKQYSRH